MRRRHRSLRDLIAELRLTPEERVETRAEHCIEALFDRERCGCADLGEREEAALEAERRRWAHTNASETASSTGL